MKQDLTSAEPRDPRAANNVSAVKKCRVCGHSIQAFMSFGKQPIANLASPDVAREQFTYELKPALCEACGLLQLIEVPSGEILFNETYPFFTGTSELMIRHFGGWAEQILARLKSVHDPFIVEVGSNDGTFLANVARHGVRHLGVEPAKSVATVARARGVNTQESFFGSETARHIRAAHGPADVIVAANVIAHISSIMDVAAGVAELLKDDGIFTFEAVSLADVIRNTEFDQFYDEHVFTFSVRAVKNLFAQVDLELVDVGRQSTHGGSLRYVLAKKGRLPVTPAVAAALDDERRSGLEDTRTYEAFAQRCSAIRDNLKSVLQQLHARGEPVIGYGATAKSTTVLNYCGIDSRLVEFIVDNTPVKQGRLTPRTRIPIRPPSAFAERNQNYTLLLAWNHRSEIEAKEAAYRTRGGKWIVYIPTVEIV